MKNDNKPCHPFLTMIKNKKMSKHISDEFFDRLAIALRKNTNHVKVIELSTVVSFRNEEIVVLNRELKKLQKRYWILSVKKERSSIGTVELDNGDIADMYDYLLTVMKK